MRQTSADLMGRSDPNFALGGSKSSRLRIVGQCVEKGVLVRYELLYRLDVLIKNGRKC
jgi:hypothetical protein